jgi:hypothetical protein
MGPCHNDMACARVADAGDGLQMWKVAADILNKQSRTADMGLSSSSGVRCELTAPHRERSACYEMLHSTSDLAGSWEHGDEPSSSIKGGELLD